MPASDDSFYNIKRLHVVFAVASLALLAATVWMVAADHFRPWKVYQRTYRDRIEPWLTEAELRQDESKEYLAVDRALEKTLADARSGVPDRALVRCFCDKLEAEAPALKMDAAAEVGRIRAAYEALAAEPDANRRDPFVAALDRVVAAAAFPQEKLQQQLRFRRAELDEARTGYDSAVGEGLPQKEQDALQTKVDGLARQVETLRAQSEEAAARHDALAAIRHQITAAEDRARQALAKHRASVSRLDRALAAERPNLGKRLLRLPFVDAFGRPLAVDQIWLPDLTIDYNFCQVPRFDRCRTCHQGIERKGLGIGDWGIEKNTNPSLQFPIPNPQSLLTVKLATPSEPPKPEEPSLEAAYGLTLAPEGMLEADAATVELVLPKSPAAMARLQVGDVIEMIAGREIKSRADAVRSLVSGVPWGKPLELVVRRGLPEPYCSHPRLDLFVGSESPHPAAEFGCTICHEGQPSATDFEYASHTPNTLADRTRWSREHGWSPSAFWDYPMLASRFAESRCLKCHHEVTDLEPSARFPDPPAKKLLAGYNLIRQNGCFGCHEIRGVSESGRSVGPDMRLEPNYSEAAQQLLADPALSDGQKTLARKIADRPELSEPRHELTAAVKQESLARGSRAAYCVLAADVPNPGTMRKVGPTLRHVADKLDAVFLDDWTRTPKSFRPDTRMPELYGMHKYLDGTALADVQRYEAVEIRAITECLLTASQPLAPLAASKNAGPPSPERGKRLFQTRGCLGCHKHADFPKAQSTFGPDLTNLGAKLTTASGKAWLVDWIRDPHRRSPRTLMPTPRLEDAADSGDSGSTDPAADIAAYLLGSADWKPALRAPLVESDLDELALMHLTKTFSRRDAEEYLAEGIPASLADEVPVDAAELVGPVTLEKKLRYVGRRTIAKRGCFGCHDIPGFENAQGIGPALSDWGRKQESLLGFDQVEQSLAAEDKGILQPPIPASNGPDRAYFEQAVAEQRREGFLWEKLRAPRSFDYKIAQNKGFNEWLTMGRFTLSAAEREAIMTFVLGLVAEPPAAKYVYHPDAAGRALAKGRKVLDRHGCAECHTMELERWQFEFDPDTFQPPPELPEFDFLKPRFTADQIAASTATDARGMAHAEVVGMPRLDSSGQPIEDVDEDDNPLYFFTLWEPALIGGQVSAAGGADVMISEPQITARRPPWGGALARLLFPTVLEEARAAGSTATEMEAFGWLPPSLAGEGAKVQPDWLYKYLLNPTPIRPAAVMQMPKPNLSPEEAAALVDYFAAAESQARRLHPAGQADPASPFRLPPSSVPSPPPAKRLDEAMRLVTDRVTFCAKCHQIGDYSPGDAIRTSLAPNLGEVGSRIRPDYLRRWIGDPKTVLPYTGMPVNFPPTGPPLGQDLLPGPSTDQIDSVRGLLLDYDPYIKSRTSIRAMVEPTESGAP